MTRFSPSYVPLSDAVTAGGNRIAKHVYSATGVFEKSTYYVRDASGNVMATYEIGSEEGEQSEAYRLIERPIYGSSRVGLDVTEVEWIVATDGMGQPIDEVAPPVTANNYTRELGHKQYEMSNHWGNCASPYASPKRRIRDSHPVRNYTGVLVVVNDIKMTVISANRTHNGEICCIGKIHLKSLP